MGFYYIVGMCTSSKHTQPIDTLLYPLVGRATVGFHSVKSKKLRHIRSFSALKLSNLLKSYERSLYENDAEHVPANRISGQQNLCITVTSSPTHTQRKRLKFSETALSFAVKVKLSTFICIFLCKITEETTHASYV